MEKEAQNRGVTRKAFYPVAEAGSFRPGSGRTVHVRGREFALFRLDDGSFCAVDDACPHQRASLGEGFQTAGRLVCPRHGWAFDLKTGHCLNNPEQPVRVYPARVAGGMIEIELEI